MEDERLTIGRLADVAATTQTVRLVGEPSVVIADLHHDSRQVGPGGAFIAVVGDTADGHDFAAGAADRGARALVVERALDLDLPQLVVEHTRPLMAPLAAEVHGHPADRTTVVGVTGTNGKTTVTRMLESVARTAGRRTGVVGTLGARIDGVPRSLGHTTPEATDLQRLLRTMVDAGVELVAMEVSSHALAYGRTDAIGFAVGAFTNLSHDHLDFHGDMEAYFATKQRLFERSRCRRAVVFVDDPWGRRLADAVDIPVTTVGFEPGADVVGLNPTFTPTASTFDVRSKDDARPLRLPMGAWFNAANALVTWATASEVGIPPAYIDRGLSEMPTVPGRLETVEAGQPFTVIVDYAHTPEAMATIIAAVAPDAPGGRVIALGGAGGERDSSKRPLMGAALARADIAVITSDNPRSEEPGSIVDAVAAGARGGEAEIVVEVDRRAAIGEALGRARPGDVVLLLGKGHETDQELAGRVRPLDDHAVATETLEHLGWGGAGP